MKNIKLLAIAVAALIISGCSTVYSGISKADKPGSYYIVTNSSGFVSPNPGVELCKADKSGNLTCKSVEVDD